MGDAWMLVILRELPRAPICLTTYSTHDLRTPALKGEYGEIEHGGLPATNDIGLQHY